MTHLYPLVVLAGGGHGDEEGMTFALIWYALAAMAILPTIVLLGVFFSARHDKTTITEAENGSSS